MHGTIIQVSLSKGGVPKLAVPAAWAAPSGFEGDVQRNTKYHGGPRQALLLVSAEDLERLRGAGYPVSPGSLGENLTTLGLDFRLLRAGQRFRAGGAVIELTKLRRPCHNLDVYNPPGLPPIQKQLFDERAKAEDPSTPLWAMGGFYAAVLLPGQIRQGDTICLLDQKV